MAIVDPVKAIEDALVAKVRARRAMILAAFALRTTRCVNCGDDGGERRLCCSQFTYDDGLHLYPACKRCCWKMGHDPMPRAEVARG